MTTKQWKLTMRGLRGEWSVERPACGAIIQEFSRDMSTQICKLWTAKRNLTSKIFNKLKKEKGIYTLNVLTLNVLLRNRLRVPLPQTLGVWTLRVALVVWTLGVTLGVTLRASFGSGKLWEWRWEWRWGCKRWGCKRWGQEWAQNLIKKLNNIYSFPFFVKQFYF